MQDLASLLGRDGMDSDLRHLAYVTVAIAKAEWGPLEGALVSAQASGLERRLLEETLLQGTLFFGFPKAVTAFERLVSVWPAPPPHGGGLPRGQWSEAGERLFSAVYGENEASVRAMLAGFHKDFHDFVLESAYGRILSRPAMGPRIRELLAVAGLAALDHVPQMVAHGRGALAFGAAPREVREAVFTAVGEPRRCEELSARILRSMG